jgi:hypothetical protein
VENPVENPENTARGRIQESVDWDAMATYLDREEELDAVLRMIAAAKALSPTAQAGAA